MINADPLLLDFVLFIEKRSKETMNTFESKSQALYFTNCPTGINQISFYLANAGALVMV